MGSEFGEFKPESLVNAAADAVAANGGFEDFFRDDDAEALMMFSVSSIDK